MSHYGPGPRWVSGFSRSPLCHGVSSSSARHASVGVGVIAVAAQRAVGRSWQPTAVSMRPFLVLPLAIASDAAQVLSLPLRSRRKSGHFETMDIDAAGSSPRIATRRALATLGTTVTPASIVVDVDDDGIMTLHSLPTVGVHVEEGFAKR